MAKRNLNRIKVMLDEIKILEGKTNKKKRHDNR